ncbi:MAG: YceD family protein [Burkholderiales bacterium]|nr:YceD family protein [Burkholderiales bacterium]
MARPNEQARPWIDTQEFTRTGGRLEGQWPIARLPRLADMLVDSTGVVDWTIQGERVRRADEGYDAGLSLAFSATVRMPCVRCLEPVEVFVEDERRYRLVVSESIAEREDAEAQDHDILVSSAHLELVDLIEDEAIMALPLAPRHDRCQPPPGADSVTGEGIEPPPVEAGAGEAAEERPNPFAVLARLKRGGTDGGGSN